MAVLGGGLGCAIALPVARALHQAGNQVDLIGGFKTKDIVILEEEMGQACTDLHICTDARATSLKFAFRTLASCSGMGVFSICILAIHGTSSQAAEMLLFRLGFMLFVSRVPGNYV